MANLPNWSLSQQSRGRMAEFLRGATKLGLDPDAVATGGLAGLRAMMALRRATDAGEGAGRASSIARIQATLRSLDPVVHGDLLQQMQSRILALQGRNGDTEDAHVARGEIALPKTLQTPAILNSLREAAKKANVPLNRLSVGNDANSINPRTGVAEFAGTRPSNPPHVNAFFDAHRGRLAALADEMKVPPNFLIGLSAGESNWGRPQGRNNLFGFSVNERPLDYPTPDAAIDAFRKSQWYSRLRGKSEASDFLNELVNTEDGKKKYNSVRPGGYAPWIKDMIGTVDRRLPIWERP